ncbi:MAG TPA: FAD-dependent oxidoreductase [Stellaceae bacterium]|jgi:NADPH-dependent 2,4-dienoyl-CoA reductase/sulfur reductase-like enzyme/nitrite reductase/ring-hydroxylating ferredoxin subunit|nr:FAD-dependent oxidoreductase [Stellaceae bacterium]
MSDAPSTTGPDLAAGIAASELADGKTLVGHVGEENVLLVRRGAEIFAIDATCSHYGGPLGEGLLTGDAVRCPWHHACFSIRTGEALHAPALSPVACWSVEQQSGKIFVRGKKPDAAKKSPSAAAAPGKIVIIGGGAAGFAAAERLRREGYANSIVMISEDAAPPVDRPNLSKDYLAGNAPEEWIPLRPDDFYAGNKIDLRLKSSVAAIDPRAKEIALGDGSKLAYDRLLLATGAAPIKLPLPGADLPHVFTLRTLADSRAIIARAANAKRAVVIGASFIGLEAAAALRNRNVDVHVVAPEKIPMERVLGPQMGAFVRALHEEHGVVFHLENTPTAIDPKQVTLNSGATIEADLVVMGVGVRPRLTLAEKAGLKIDRGVAVDQYLQTSAPDIFAAGDIARWPDPHCGQAIRVEHWVVAERQGATAAFNLLGQRVAFNAVPFFWSQHYDVPINYVGHAESWDEIAIDGDIGKRDCVLRYKKGGKTLAVTSIYRDRDSLEAEFAMERGQNP